MCASEEDGLPQAGIICSYCLSCCCNLSEVVGAFVLGRGDRSQTVLSEHDGRGRDWATVIMC
jgi:hypothetical protein